VARAAITERDRELLEFAAEHRLILSTHAQALLGVTAGTAEARLRALGSRGLVRREPTFDGQPLCFQITRAGLRAVGSRLPQPRPNLAEYAHDVGLGWLWLAAKAGMFGPLTGVVSERRMRSHDGAPAAGDRDPFGVRLGGVGARGRDRLHYPDLLLLTKDGRRVAVELELTTKERTRRETILAGYGADGRVDAVLYLVSDARVGRAIQRTAARLRISHLVRVQRVRWGSKPPPGVRGPARDRARAPRHGRFVEAGR
jgi:hypothetical protein